MDAELSAAILKLLRDNLTIELSHSYNYEGNCGELLHWVTLHCELKFRGETVTETAHTIELRTPSGFHYGEDV